MFLSMMTIYSYSFAKKFNHAKFCFRPNKCFLLSLLLGACNFRSLSFFSPMQNVGIRSDLQHRGFVRTCILHEL